MKSYRDKFSHQEAEKIRQILRELRERVLPKSQQTALRNRLRDMGFYISQYSRKPTGFTANDFDYFVRVGRITLY